MENPKWVTEKGAAEILGLHHATLGNWRSKDKGPPYSTVGTDIRYKVSDLFRYLEKRKVIPKNER